MCDIVKTNENSVIIAHPALGELLISKDRITKIDIDLLIVENQNKKTTNQRLDDKNITKAPAAEVIEAIEVESEVEKEKKEEATFWSFAWLEKWTKSISVGFSGTDGNSEISNLNAGIKANREDKKGRLDFSCGLFYANNSGKESKNQFFAQLHNDWKIADKRWFLFGQTRYDYDRFQAFKHRVAPAGGLGYQIFDIANLKLRGQSGYGFSYSFGEVEDKFIPELNLGLNGTWEIGKSQTVNLNAQAFPNVSDKKDQFRSITNLDWSIKMDQIKGLSLKLGMTHEYNSETSSSKPDNNDMKYYGSMVFDF